MSPPTTPNEFYSADSFTREPSVGWLLRQIKQSMICQADKLLGKHDLTHAQWAPMLRLRFNGPMSSAALARELAMDGGAMTRLLDRLEAKNLVQRERSTEDRRVVMVSLTEHGLTVMTPAPAILSKVSNDHLAGFTQEEFRTLIGMLQRMVANGQAIRDAGHASETPSISCYPIDDEA
ncbi:DNA-binding transcriptional regulator, MarR family [Roseateles sp. YR242]|uniref:MarR family winged helix-turn-helix transcriptional regulator n=1 Tax=Roseateles sp. YR242 TaxID=1855305 RepID=UPI0008D2D167|nr:MarR family transcriptional regulator [Roseateles sp. YR242]SEL06864.1 DNA-binding transcriptional regulator, MarR family [Roseateles sp. YR242]